MPNGIDHNRDQLRNAILINSFRCQCMKLQVYKRALDRCCVKKTEDTFLSNADKKNYKHR